MKKGDFLQIWRSMLKSKPLTEDFKEGILLLVKEGMGLAAGKKIDYGVQLRGSSEAMTTY